jgi:NAD(P)-dependent dehydrogenase (short-subunit alcohol dehydrogenase family)
MEECHMSTTIENAAILVTGANRGIGQALVTEALDRGAARVYAGTRRPYTHPDPRVTVLPLDVTDDGQVRAAAGQVASLDILINNAGVFGFDDLSDHEALERHLPAYSLSKAAAFSLTQSLRMLLAARGVRVHAALVPAQAAA